jgi:uncharacterized SAM-binding protein YcdF (DUF218 family)
MHARFGLCRRALEAKMGSWRETARHSAVQILVFFFCSMGALSVLIVLTPFPNLLARPLMRMPSHPAPADVVVVLSGGRYADGTLTESAIRRTVMAVRLYHNGLAPMLLFTGGTCCGNSSSAGMARLARDLAVPAAAIVLEEHSRRTRDSARNTGALLRRLGLRRALLVTSPLHMARSQWTFQAANVDVILVAADDTDLRLVTSASGRAGLMEASLHEYIGILYYKLRGWI